MVPHTAKPSLWVEIRCSGGVTPSQQRSGSAPEADLHPKHYCLGAAGGTKPKGGQSWAGLPASCFHSPLASADRAQSAASSEIQATPGVNLSPPPVPWAGVGLGSGRSASRAGWGGRVRRGIALPLMQSWFCHSWAEYKIGIFSFVSPPSRPPSFRTTKSDFAYVPVKSGLAFSRQPSFIFFLIF